MPVVAGVTGISIEGIGDFETSETATVIFGGRVVGESIVGGNGKIGRSYKGVAASIETTIFFPEGVSAEVLKDVVDKNVTIKAVDRNIIMTGSDFIDAPNLDLSKSSVNAKFEGVRATEVF